MAEEREKHQNTSSEPMELPASFSCKVILDHEELPRLSRQWTRAKKTSLDFGSDGLSYAEVFTPYEEIEEATLHIYESALFIEYGILSISTSGGKHHFGIKYSDEWHKELPFPVVRIKESTPFLLYRKILILCIVIYIFWELIRM